MQIELGAKASTAQEWFECGQQHEDREDSPTAVDAYEKAITLLPRYPIALFNLGNVLRMMGRFAQAQRMYETALDQDRGLAVAWYNLADLHEQRGHVQKSTACLQEAVREAPSYEDAHFNLALCLEKLGRKREADQHWARYLELDPHSQWAGMARSCLTSRSQEQGTSSK